MQLFSKKKNKAKASAFNKNTKKLLRQRIILLVFLLICCALPPFFVNNPIGYVPAITIVILFAMSICYLFRIKSCLTYVAEFSKVNCSRGSDVEFSVNIKNKSIMPAIRLEFQFYVSDLYGSIDKEICSSTSLLGKKDDDFCIEISFAHIGTYTAGLNSILIYDPLGLFFLKVPCNSSCSIEVTPNIVDSIEMEISSEIMRESERMMQAVVSDDMDYVGVRDYVIGDQMKSIHWKLSARKRQHLTRLFETRINPSMTAIIDFHAPKYSSEELMCCNDALLESALSLENFARNNGFDTELEFINRKGFLSKYTFFAGSDLEELFFSMKDLPLPSSEIDKNDALNIIRDEEHALSGQGVILFCTTWLDEETLNAVLECRAKRKNVIVFFVVPKSKQHDFSLKHKVAFSKLQTAHVSYFIIADADDLVVGA